MLLELVVRGVLECWIEYLLDILALHTRTPTLEHQHSNTNTDPANMENVLPSSSPDFNLYNPGRNTEQFICNDLHDDTSEGAAPYRT